MIEPAPDPWAVTYEHMLATTAMQRPIHDEPDRWTCTCGHASRG